MTLQKSKVATKNGARPGKVSAGPKEPYILKIKRRLMIII
jgi:hypothetical protein